MQRIVCRYQIEPPADTLGPSEVRRQWMQAVAQAGLPLAEGRRALVFGPPLPPGATSEAERCLLELAEPREPTVVRDRLNGVLPPGLRIEQAWITHPGETDELPGALETAVYVVTWADAPPRGELLTRLHRFLSVTDVPFVRHREKKVQTLNARAFVEHVRLGASPAITQELRLVMTVSVGSQGSLRPEEILQVLGYPDPGPVQVHRVALHPARRAGSRALDARRWERLVES